MTDWEARYYEAQALHTEANGMLTAENERLRCALSEVTTRAEAAELRHQSGTKLIPLDRTLVARAAEDANRNFGQWMPDAWLRLFEDAYEEWVNSEGVCVHQVNREPGAWLIFFDDAEVKPEVFTGKGAAAAAKARFAFISDNWNAHLFALVESNTRDAAEANRSQSVACNKQGDTP